MCWKIQNAAHKTQYTLRTPCHGDLVIYDFRLTIDYCSVAGQKVSFHGDLLKICPLFSILVRIILNE